MQHATIERPTGREIDRVGRLASQQAPRGLPCPESSASLLRNHVETEHRLPCATLFDGAAGVMRPVGRASAQLFLQRLVHQGRVGLALGGFHHLADEEAEQLVLAAPVLFHLVGIGGQYGIHLLHDGAGVRDLS